MLGPGLLRPLVHRELGGACLGFGFGWVRVREGEGEGEGEG